MSRARVEADQRRRKAHPWRKWYGTKAWKIRRSRQLKAEPLCRTCAAAGRSRPATVADHVIPHRGDRRRFFFGELQSLCADCHNIAKQREETEGFTREIGDDGWPTDPRHIFNRPRRFST